MSAPKCDDCGRVADAMDLHGFDGRTLCDDCYDAACDYEPTFNAHTGELS